MIAKVNALRELQSTSGAPKSVLTSRERCSKRVAPNAEVDGPQS